jgi:multidrug efflux system membrane fusion protein
VTEGLNPGDVVVTSGADRLREGSTVELPGEEPPAPAKGNAAAEDGKRQWRRGEGQPGQGRGPGERRRRDGGDGNAPKSDNGKPAAKDGQP